MPPYTIHIHTTYTPTHHAYIKQNSQFTHTYIPQMYAYMWHTCIYIFVNIYIYKHTCAHACTHTHTKYFLSPTKLSRIMVSNAAELFREKKITVWNSLWWIIAYNIQFVWCQCGVQSYLKLLHWGDIFWCLFCVYESPLSVRT